MYIYGKNVLIVPSGIETTEIELQRKAFDGINCT